MRDHNAPARPARRCSTCMRRGILIRPVLFGLMIQFACAECRKKLRAYPIAHGSKVLATALVHDVQVITMREPWAWLVMEGFKDLENRKWHTVFSGRVFIHSAKEFDKDWNSICKWVADKMGVTIPSKQWLAENHAGRLIAVAEFEHMVNQHPSPWKIPEQNAWPIKFCWPIVPTEKVRGMLGLWRLQVDNMKITLP